MFATYRVVLEELGVGRWVVDHPAERVRYRYGLGEGMSPLVHGQRNELRLGRLVTRLTAVPSTRRGRDR